MTHPRLAHVMVFTKDLPKMQAFYEKAFELTPESSVDPGFVILRAKAGAGIALHALPQEVSASFETKSPPDFREETCLKPCFEVSDLDAQRQRIVDCGGQAKPPWEWEGTRFAECADPEGNVLQIYEARRVSS